MKKEYIKPIISQLFTSGQDIVTASPNQLDVTDKDVIWDANLFGNN